MVMPHKNKPRAKALLLEIRSDIQHTTAHGIPNIFRARHWFRRWLWALLVIFAFCCAFWQCMEMVMTFYSYPSHEKITLISNSKLMFPAVTICNLNSLRRTALEKNFALNSTLSWNRTSFSSSARDANRCGFFSNKFASEFNRLSEEEKLDMGHQLEDMLIFCTYHGRPCNTSFFSGFVNYKFGNCYTFNSHKNTDIRGKPINGVPLNTTKAGFTYGLHMELFIQQTEYVRDITHSAGIRLLVHDQHATPFPEDEGVNIPPGTETDIGITRIGIRRLKHPYGSNCTDGEGITNYYHDLYGSKYTREACKRSCAQYSIMDDCGCSHWEFAVPPGMNYPKCNLSSSTTRRCLELYEYKFSLDMLPCHCPLQCKEELFDLTVSGSQWPATAYLDKFSSNLRNKGEQLRAIADNQQKIRDNLLKVVVYYQKMNYEHISEEPSITDIDLFSNVGGLVGLWVGVSLCTLAEFLEIVINVVLTMARSCLGTSTQGPPPPALMMESPAI
ncbi:amiloride-sensitive sodium channel subunit gamma-like [Brienomyrus brachyistius]|uniref:amiloride-sensitive sodium channel subunit gamma-like n=1 Tax=Brienomyrus brachyistius TaxID=42636 RepID=UPI0020B35BAC|nr:amiloride-sensitive sodium channel subunit gamma-like [Brienomyrus brachyistius]